MPPTIIGIDPGGTYTGIVVRRGPELLRAVTVTREHGPSGPHQSRADYLTEVLEVADELAPLAALIAAEDVVAPTGFADGERHPIDPEGLIGTSVILGGILGHFAGVILVPPGSKGALPLGHYPAALVGRREVKGKGKLRHLRSAWDVAGFALLTRRARSA